MLAAIILAAGGSTRFGSPKQLAMLEGESLLARAVRLAREAGARPVYGVLGANRDEIRMRVDLSSASVLLNEDWQQGMGSSLRLAARALLDVEIVSEHVLLMVCDQPAVTVEHLQKLIAAAMKHPSQPVASQYANRAGVPAILPAALLPKLLLLAGDEGARAILAQQDTVLVELRDGEVDFDTPEDIENWQKKKRPLPD